MLLVAGQNPVHERHQSIFHILPVLPGGGDQLKALAKQQL
jgi:hypothetical protein